MEAVEWTAALPCELNLDFIWSERWRGWMSSGWWWQRKRRQRMISSRWRETSWLTGPRLFLLHLLSAPAEGDEQVEFSVLSGL